GRPACADRAARDGLALGLRPRAVALRSHGVEVASRTRPGSGHAVNDYATLKGLILRAGLLQKQPRFYVLLIGVNTALFALCIGGFAVLRNPRLQALNAVGLALISAQLRVPPPPAGPHQMFARGGRDTPGGLLTAR